MSVLAERLRIARERKNLKQIQVKEKTGINNKTLSGYENGVSAPDPDTLATLAKLYEVSADYLIGRTDKNHFINSADKTSATDIGQCLEQLLGQIDAKNVTIYGVPMDETIREFMKAQIEVSLRVAEQMARKRAAKADEGKK
ncbi:MAG: helix-turn-helix domain-containing protein [Sporolactobacillus sp.]|jgi:transcriptional regulator with XRE-family HTH domain|nr:helix-turn-helix domain-containing protein [Sporolactobacillus sp.]